MRPDVVHSHLVHANILARVTRLFVRIPFLVCTAHNVNEGGWRRELLYRLTDPLGDLLTNVSQEAVRIYTERRIAPARKIRLMENGIDLSRFAEDPRQRRQLRAELGWSKGAHVRRRNAGRKSGPEQVEKVNKPLWRARGFRRSRLSGWLPDVSSRRRITRLCC